MLDPDLLARASVGTVIAVVGGHLAAARWRRPAVSAAVDGDDLVVAMHEWDAVWAMRRRVRVPLTAIHSVTVEEMPKLPSHGWPTWGTYVPGVLRAGTFIVDGQPELWHARGGPGQLLKVELAPDAPWRRLLVQVSDPQTAATTMRRFIRPYVPAWY